MAAGNISAGSGIVKGHGAAGVNGRDAAHNGVADAVANLQHAAVDGRSAGVLETHANKRLCAGAVFHQAQRAGAASVAVVDDAVEPAVRGIIEGQRAAA